MGDERVDEGEKKVKGKQGLGVDPISALRDAMEEEPRMVKENPRLIPTRGIPPTSAKPFLYGMARQALIHYCKLSATPPLKGNSRPINASV